MHRYSPLTAMNTLSDLLTSFAGAGPWSGRSAPDGTQRPTRRSNVQENASANSPPTFRRNVKAVVVVVLAAALAGGFAAAADSPSAPANFVGMTPVRVLDTRNAIGVPGTGPIPPDASINFPVAGVNGIPADATSVA